VTDGLAPLGWPGGASLANFVWPALGPRAEAAADAFQAAGVLVRSIPGERVRISVGTREADDRVLTVAARIGIA
jgi:histidinol-phosphate aminotransferase